jgi:hypothetical protein
MGRKHYINSDPTAWKAISWVDREAAKKDIRPKAEKLKRSKIAVEGRENRKVHTYTKDREDTHHAQNLEV